MTTTAYTAAYTAAYDAAYASLAAGSDAYDAFQAAVRAAAASTTVEWDLAAAVTAFDAAVLSHPEIKS